MDSFEKTLELFRKGLPVHEIAFERKLAFSTIENHLRLLIEKNKIQLDELLSEEKIALIRSAIPEDAKSLSEIKALLPADVTYGEIKWVLTSLGKLKQPKPMPPITKAINTYVGNNCTRKCFNHGEIFSGCRKNFEHLAQSMGDSAISVSEFFKFMNSGEIKICKLPLEKRKKIVYWDKFEEMSARGKDLWDSP